LGDAESSLGDTESSLGDAKSSLGDTESSLGGAKSSLGDAKSSLGDVKDDPLAAVDAHVGKALLRDCFLGFLAGRTRLLVTNALHVLPEADHVVVSPPHTPE
jgi:ATP-binding cassette subfamily C (CFTR/MRP) protein 1